MEWHAAQLRDQLISKFLLAKEVKRRPVWQDVASRETSSKIMVAMRHVGNRKWDTS